GARVNRSTGLHVHVGFDRTDCHALARLVYLVSNYEKALFASTGTRSREQGDYCRTVRHDQTYVQQFAAGNRHANVNDRYHVLNLTHPGTVEFRVFAGTTNVVKIVGYIRLCLALVQKALMTGKRTKWIGKKPVETSPLHRKGGEGQT